VNQEKGGGSAKKSNTLQVILGLAAIILLAVLIRFYKLEAWSFWIDEIYTINRALGEYSYSTPITERLLGMTLNYLTLDEWSARLIPAIIGVISIPILFFPIKRIFNTRVAFLTVLMLAMSTVHLFWSQNSRYYVALLLFYNLALFAFYLWIESERILYLVLTFLFFGLALIERKVALYILPVMMVYLMLVVVYKVERPKGLGWRNILFFIVPVSIGGLIFFITGSPDFQAQFLIHTTNPLRFGLGVVYDLGLPLVLIATAGAVFSIKEKDRAGILMVSGAFVPLILLLIATPFSLVTSRYLFATLPSWLILAAIVIDKVSQMGFAYAKPLALLLIGIIVIDSLSQDVLYFGYQNGNRADWKNAFNLVQNSMEETDLVVASRHEIGDYYLDHEVIPSYSVSPEKLTAQGKRAWFVLDNQTGNVSHELRSWLNENGQLRGIMDVSLPGKLFEMRVFLFQPD
jgi:hypothetical protein